MAGKTLDELAKHVGGSVVGNGGIVIKGVSTLDKAGPGEITFLTNKKYVPQLKTTKAGAVITAETLETETPLLVAAEAYYALMEIVVLLHGHRKHKKVGISKRASIAQSAKVGDNCNIHDFATISDNVRIGANCQIYPGVFVGPNVQIGDDCIIYSNAVIYDDSIVGDRVIIHANASVGQDGFGFATHEGVHHKIPQIGRAILEDDVEIGACSVIECGTLDDTVIGKGSKIGDAVAIGHGTIVGPYCLLVPQVGVAGSTVLGHHCVLGGQVGVVGHIKIGNMVRIGAQAGVSGNVPDGATIMGAPAIDAGKAKRAYALIGHLPDMRKRLRKLERQAEQSQAEK